MIHQVKDTIIVLNIAGDVMYVRWKADLSREVFIFINQCPADAKKKLKPAYEFTSVCF